MTPAASTPTITRPREEESTEVIERPEFTLGDAGVVPAAGGAEAVSVALEATLVAVDREAAAISALPVVFGRRVTVGDVATLFGTDASRAIRVVARVSTDPPSLKLNLRYSDDASALPRELLPALRLLRALHRPNRLALRIGDRSVGEVDELPIDAGFPQDFVELVRSVAFVQAMSGIAFPLPPHLDHDDRRTLREAEALLRGETVTSKWANATLGLSTIDAELLGVIEGDGLFRLEFVAPVVARIASHDLPLGEAQYVFRMARLENYDELRQAAEGDVTAAEARLLPGADDAYEVRLLSPPTIGFDDQDVRATVAASATNLEAARHKPLRRDAFRPTAS